MVFCQLCNLNPATRTLFSNQGQQALVCELCAVKAEGGSVAHQMLLPVVMHHVQIAVVACPNCGTTLQQLTAASLLGCSECYRHFRESLLPTIQRMQGTVCHKPRTARGPQPPEPLPGEPELPQLEEAPTLETLQKRLEQAVTEERYEDAARIRDQIRARNRHD